LLTCCYSIHVGQHLLSPFRRKELFDRLLGELRLFSAFTQLFEGIDDFRIIGGSLVARKQDVAPWELICIICIIFFSRKYLALSRFRGGFHQGNPY
jgi:hypothetical protein